MRANRYVSYLAAEIEPKAIANLSRFEAATEATFNRIEKFSTRGAGGLAGPAISPRAVTSAREATAALRKTRTEVDLAGSSVRRLTRDSSVMGNSLTQAGMALQVVQGPLGPLAGRLSALGAAFRTLSGFSLAGVLSGGSAFAIGTIATGYQNVTDRLRPFYESQKDLNGALSDVVAIAGRTRQALDPVAELYNKITQASKDAGLAQERAAALTETVAKAARLSGGAKATQEAGITQFAQGFGTNLAGEELRSIRENTPRLAKAIAEGLGVSTGALKQLGADGVLTADIIAKALERSADQINTEFSRLPLRIGDALTAAQTQLTLFFGRFDEATGATAALAAGIKLAGDNLGPLAAGAAAFVAAWNMKTVIDQFRTFTVMVDGVATQQRGAVAQAKDYVAAQMERNRREREWGQAINAANTPLYDTRGAVIAIARANEYRAREEQAAAKKSVAGLREQQGALRTNLNLVNQQLAAAKRQRSTAQTLVAANPNNAGAQRALAAANAEVAAAQKARITTSRALAQTDTQLAAAERNLIQTETALAAATMRTGVAMGVQNTKVVILTRSMAMLTAAKRAALAAATGLVGFLGGAWGVAFTAAIAVVGFLASKTNAALDAVDSFKGGQEALAEKLGITTSAMGLQTQAARELAIALAEANLQDAKKKRGEAGADLGASLRRGAFGISGPLRGMFPGQRGQDARELIELAEKAERGQFDFAKDFARLNAIRKRNPNDFKGDFLSEFLGNNPADYARKAMGVAAVNMEIAQSEQNLADTRTRVAAAAAAPPIKLPTAKTRAQLAAEAKIEASGVNEVAKARANLAKVTADADAALKAGSIGQDEWVEKVAEATRQVNSAVEAEKARKAGIAANAKAQREAAKSAREAAAAIAKEERAVETAADKWIRLQNVMQGFEDQPKGMTRAARAKNSISDLVGERVGTGVYTKEDFERDSARIDEAIRKPITDAIREQERLNYLQGMILNGRVHEAELLERALRLVDDVGDISDADLDILRQQLARHREINEAMEARAQMIDVYAEAWASLRQEGENFIRTLMDARPLDALRDGIAGLMNTFKDQWSKKLSIELFGDPEKAFREEMTRGLNNSAGKLLSAADVLHIAGRALGQAADKQNGIGVASGYAPPSLEDAADAVRSATGAVVSRTAEQAFKDFVGELRERGVAPGAGRTGFRTASDQRDIHRQGLTNLDGYNKTSPHQFWRALDPSKRTQNDAKATAAAIAAGLKGFRIVNESGGRKHYTWTGHEDVQRPIESTAQATETVAEHAATIAENTAATTAAVQEAAATGAPGAIGGPPIPPGFGTPAGGIVVTGQRQAPPALPRNPTQQWNEIGKVLSTRVFGANSPITRIASRMGTMFEGAAYGGIGGGMQRMTGMRGSRTGAALGGAVGQAFGGKLVGQAMTSVLGPALGKTLGSFAGPLGGIIGGFIGSAVGGLFKRRGKGSATIGSIDGDVKGSGKYGDQASGMAGSVQDGLRRISEALGGGVGRFGVSIGYREGKSNPYRVDPTGRGRVKGSGVQIFKTEEEAIRAAILNALQDGAITGIREGAKRLLRAGKDIDRALDKAFKFESVFRRLKGYTDPVGAAVDDLNREFEALKKIFTEAGASASEWADLQKLYEFERAKAIEEASNQTLSALRDFINNNLKGTDSPLSKRTVYDNNRAAFEKAQTDFAAGKITGNDLVKVLEQFQAASRELNGSRSSFFQDFDAIMALAQKAADAAPGAGGATPGTNLPPSPFDEVVRDRIGTTNELLAEQNRLLQEWLAGGRVGPAPVTGGAISILPGNTPSSGGGSRDSFVGGVSRVVHQ